MGRMYFVSETGDAVSQQIPDRERARLRETMEKAGYREVGKPEYDRARLRRGAARQLREVRRLRETG